MPLAQTSNEATDVESAPPPPLDRRSLNLPNLITLSRLVLSIVLFALIDANGWWRTATIVFLVAAATTLEHGRQCRTEL